MTACLAKMVAAHRCTCPVALVLLPVLIFWSAGRSLACSTTSVKVEVFVSTAGSDKTGTGAKEKPFETLQKAVDKLNSLATRGRAAIWLRYYQGIRCTYKLSSAVSLPDSLCLATYDQDVRSGYGEATVSGGYGLTNTSERWRPAPCSMANAPFNDAGTDFSCGLWQYNITSSVADRIGDRVVHSIWVDGERQGLVRSPMMQWLRSLDESNQTAEINHYGFVYSPFPADWSLDQHSTQFWILTAFHQWASDVHSIREIIPSNSTLFVNEPTYWKYAFDDNVRGKRRFFVENVPEQPMLKGSGTFRIVRQSGHDILIYASLDSKSPAQSEVTLPILTELIVSNGSYDVTIENITMSHTTWLLPMQKPGDYYPGSWRHSLEAEVVANKGSATIGGSGPLPVPTAALDIRNSSNVSLSNVIFRNIGADGMSVKSSATVSLRRSTFSGLGASGLVVYDSGNIQIEDSSFLHAGRTWRQGVGVWFSRSKSLLVWHCLFANLTSDAIIVSASTATTIAHSVFEALGNTHDNMSTAISDWGGVHTALPNSTQPTVNVFHNVFRNFRSYGMGANGLYFDYGSSGVTAHHNLVYDIGGPPLFLNSNGVVKEPSDTAPNHVHDNIFIHQHIRAADSNVVLLVRTLTATNFSANIVYADCSANDTAARLVQDNSAVKDQFANQVWDDNVYFNTRQGANAEFGQTFPMQLTFQAWQKTGHDRNSFLTDPLFVDPDNDHFMLMPDSPALKLGFTEFNHTDVGPRV